MEKLQTVGPRFIAAIAKLIVLPMELKKIVMGAVRKEPLKAAKTVGPRFIATIAKLTGRK